MKLLLTIAYVGCDFHGFQYQPGLRTVQGTLQKILESFYKEELLLTGCSRTDAGVHANNFCLTIEGKLFESMPPEKLPIAVAPFLPADLSILSAKVVPNDFHPRYDVDYKEYVYLIENSSVHSPFLSGRAWQYPQKLDVEKMNSAARYIIGEHDFKCFMAAGSPVNSTVRDVRYLMVERQENNVVKIRIAANGFLYNMVRIISGTLVAVSEGRILPEEIKDIIESGDRTRSGMTLPPDGLYLNRVVYKQQT
ncbi:MAG: tRNA pseudouridine(38-40) synthase TruA [Clostridia bacterium]|nr:tRNA pseudouridine(38-40) synthase TruA [Clostridia bacterium]